MLSRSHDPQGQFQGQILGQNVIVPQHVLVFKRMADLVSLWNSPSNNTNILKIDPLAPEIQGFKGRRPYPFLPKISKFGGPYLQTPHPIDLKFEIRCCEITFTKYIKFHQSKKMVGLKPLGELT